MTTGLLGMMASQKTSETMKKGEKGEERAACGKCPKDGTQTTKDDTSGYCYCPKCKQMYSPAGTN